MGKGARGGKWRGVGEIEGKGMDEEQGNGERCSERNRRRTGRERRFQQPFSKPGYSGENT